MLIYLWKNNKTYSHPALQYALLFATASSVPSKTIHFRKMLSLILLTVMDHGVPQVKNNYYYTRSALLLLHSLCPKFANSNPCHNLIKYEN